MPRFRSRPYRKSISLCLLFDAELFLGPRVLYFVGSPCFPHLVTNLERLSKDARLRPDSGSAFFVLERTYGLNLTSINSWVSLGVATLDVRLVPGVVFKQFTARDVISRWDVIQAHTRATAQTAAQFLDTLQHRMPFPIRALQVDGGSEFAAEFELACQQRRLHLFVLPPRSPKLNGAVERANRTHTEELYQVTACSLEMKKLNRELRHWEKIYNTVRPHQALGYLTPQQFLRQISSPRKE